MPTNPRHRLTVAATVCAALAVSSGAPAQAPPGTRRDSVVTASVDVDGLSMRVRTAGLRTRTPREPVVIFESGGGAPLETWDPVLPAVAMVAPVLAYDRAGTGQSAWDSLPPTPDRIVARLRRLLATLAVAPPYVLVGHSWGGALIRYFGGAWPADIAGMAYIDPTDITQSAVEEIAIFESIGAGSAARDSLYALMERAMTRAPAPLRAEGEATMAIFRQDVEARKLPPPPDVPTIGCARQGSSWWPRTPGIRCTRTTPSW